MELQPFDSLAPTYDDSFTHTKIGQHLRGRVQARLDRQFQAGDHVLELGCGTGEDALHLAKRGVRVLATEVSSAMLSATRAKTAGEPLVTVERVDLRALPLNPFPSWRGAFGSACLPFSLREKGPGDEGQMFDGAFANFGPVNVLGDRRPLAGWLAERVKPGGIVGLGVMGPLCLWEIVWHGLHLDFETALRRLDGRAVFQANDSAEGINIYYPSIARLTREFAPHFRRVHVEAVGLFLPPSDVYGMVEKRARLLRILTVLDDRWSSIAPLARLADHYWIEFERVF